jgi:SAM-dependent methyltransferase
VKTIPCEVCGSNQHRFLFEGWDRLFGTPGKFKIVQCKECHLIFVNPQPDPEALKKYYPKDYYVPNFSHYREYSWLRRKVLETYWGYGSQSDSQRNMHLFKKMVLLPFRIRYRHCIPFVEGGRVLDIGCGNGTELYKLKLMGWEAYGVEIEPEASELARSKGLSVFTGDLHKAHYPDHFFHVVRMSFVLEHLPNPKEVLLEIKRILMPEGRIYISVQNARSLNYWVFHRWWFSLDVPRHLFSFTPKTIQKLLFTLDLKINALWFDSGQRNFLVSLQYWINDRYGRGSAFQAPRPIADSRFLKLLLRPVFWMVDRLRLGDLMYLEVIKP